MAGCGDGVATATDSANVPQSSQSLTITTGSTRVLLEAMLADNDPSNDRQAAAMLEAGGISEFMSLSTEKQAALLAKHGSELVIHGQASESAASAALPTSSAGT